MIVLPAIDILDGRAVRLKQGRLDAVTVYNEDPVDQARRWIDGGATYLHVVDLDGAATGEPASISLVERIAGLGAPVQTGGGIRTMETIDRLFAAGVTRVVLGTALVTEPTLAVVACERYEGIVAGVDAREGMVAVQGWRQGTATPAEELVAELASLGIRHLVYTDISRDGMQTGINAEAYERIAAVAGFPVVASGGVSTLDDLRALAALGPAIEGVIVGRALYEGAFTLPEALAVAESAEGAGPPGSPSSRAGLEGD